MVHNIDHRKSPPFHSMHSIDVLKYIMFTCPVAVMEITWLKLAAVNDSTCKQLGGCSRGLAGVLLRNLNKDWSLRQKKSRVARREGGLTAHDWWLVGTLSLTPTTHPFCIYNKVTSVSSACALPRRRQSIRCGPTLQITLDHILLSRHKTREGTSYM